MKEFVSILQLRHDTFNLYRSYFLGHIINLPLLLIATIFGKNSKHNVEVVVIRIRLVIEMYASVALSEIMVPITTTLALVMTTEYTLIPMYFESLRADIFTFLVSQAM